MSEQMSLPETVRAVCRKCNGTREDTEGNPDRCRGCVHPFERAGLGKAPFRCVGQRESKYQACHGAPIQPGSSCDFCGTGIMQVFDIRSADGRSFVVGCDCVRKTADKPLMAAVAKLKSAGQKVKRDGKKAEERKARDEARDGVRRMRVVTTVAKHAAELDKLDVIGTGSTWGAPIARDMAARLRAEGYPLSEKQIALVGKMWAEHSGEGRATLTHVGTVGKREDFSLTLKSTRIVGEPKQFGYTVSYTWLWKFEDVNGNQVSWFASHGPGTLLPRTDPGFDGFTLTDGWTGALPVKVRGTVDKHDSYKGTPQTVLSRCKVTLPEES